MNNPGINYGKKLFSVLVFCFSFLWCKAATYYVDSATGNDSYPGTVPHAAWKSLKRVNGMVFLPGDTILFAANGTWCEALRPRGSGAPDHPIVISSYGKGNMPLFAGTGFEGMGVISLYNQSYWEISNLELTNDAPQYGDRRRIEIKAANAGIINHIKNLRIHHIRGLPGNGSDAKRTAESYCGDG